jgi:hypothetical protein
MDTARRESRFDRWVDFASVILISLSTVVTAWCGYEAARWTALETRSYNDASSLRVQAAVAEGRSNTLQTIDVATFLEYVRAVATHSTAEQTFIYKRFRPEMRVAVDAWLATKPLANPSAPSSPFAMRQYVLKTTQDAERLNALSSARFVEATQSNERSDWYVRLTVIFAAVSFLAGISTRFVFPNHLIVVVLGFAALAFGLIRMFELPIR